MRATAPIQTSTPSGGSGAIPASWICQRPSELTVSPAQSRRMMSSDSSKRDGRWLHIHAECRELVVVRPDRTLHDERPLVQRRERADLLRQQHRMPERQQEERPRGTVAPLRQQASQYGNVLVVESSARCCGGRRRRGCRAPPPAPPPRARPASARPPARPAPAPPSSVISRLAWSFLPRGFAVRLSQSVQQRGSDCLGARTLTDLCFSGRFDGVKHSRGVPLNHAPVEIESSVP